MGIYDTSYSTSVVYGAGPNSGGGTFTLPNDYSVNTLYNITSTGFQFTKTSSGTETVFWVAIK